MERLPWVWGATSDEAARHYPADEAAGARLTRAVTATAPAPLVYRWLCQLKLAPYSYDWLDNLARCSPTSLRAEADEVRVGDRVMRSFRVCAVVPGHQFTLRMADRARLFGQTYVTYAAEPLDEDRTRLVCRLSIPRRPGLRLLAWGDLVMMRKQLRTLADYAERSASVSRVRNAR